MFNRFAIRKQLTRASPPQLCLLLLTLALAAFTGPMAHASTLSYTPDCSASGDSLKCHLQQILSFLYIAAGILGFILILVITVALHVYLKNKRNRQVRP